MGDLSWFLVGMILGASTVIVAGCYLVGKVMHDSFFPSAHEKT